MTHLYLAYGEYSTVSRIWHMRTVRADILLQFGLDPLKCGVSADMSNMV